MLQPTQLKQVALRYAAPIHELREFLRIADEPVLTPDALPALLARLQQDRAFHRDVASYLWMAMEQSPTPPTAPEMLAILAIAAAGEPLAAQAHEGDAHDLLRFILDTRRAILGSTSGELPVARAPQTPPTTAETPRPAAAIEAPARFITAPYSHPVEAASHAEPRRRRWIWPAIAACLACLALGLLLLRRSTPPAADTAATTATAPSTAIITTPAPAPTAAPPSIAPSAPVRPRHLPPQPAPRPHPSLLTRLREVFTPSRQPADTENANPATTAPLEPTTPPPAETYAAAPTTTPAAKPSTATSGNTVVPESILRQSLDSPRMPADAYPAGELTAGNHKNPVLLRRQPLTGTTLAETSPAPNPATANVPAATHPPAGTVRLTTLGIMAGNLMYGPTPAYPTEASQAHVQGKVTVQAEVDRNGNVAGARVVSGPPLLRDAAITAVQQSRYKPYLAGGKPIPISTVAVVEFQLP